MIKEGFKPIVDKNTKILILGTMPSDISIKTGEYYANTKNHFWKIIFKLLNNDKPEFLYEHKIDLLLKNKVGFWDVLKKAERLGSSDSNIIHKEYNDFKYIFANFPNIKAIGFNGKKSSDYFESIKSSVKDKEYYILPSTSSANTWKSFNQKYLDWKEVLVKYYG